MDKIAKALQKLTEKERTRLKEILLKLEKGDFKGLDIKKLKGREDIFRARKGNMRIIFQKREDQINILTLERRTDTTYKS